MAEGRLRKWLLSITAFLRNQNGTLADAMALWRDNCVEEFSGMTACPAPPSLPRASFCDSLVQVATFIRASLEQVDSRWPRLAGDAYILGTAANI